MSAINRRLDKLEKQSGSKFANMTVVIVEDDESQEDALLRCGHRADTASNDVIFVSFVDSVVMSEERPSDIR